MRTALLLLAAVMGLGFPGNGGATTTTGPPNPARAFDPLLYSHLVMECTIESVEHRVVTMRDLFPRWGSPNKKAGMSVARLSNVTVLRAPTAQSVPREVMVGLDLDPQSLIGQRLLLCCYWYPSLNLFTVHYRSQAFRQEGDRWVTLKRIVGQPPDKRPSISSRELETLLQGVELPELARKADRIVIGRIRSMADTTIVTQDGERVNAQRVTLDVTSVLKGDRTTPAAWFLRSRDAQATTALGGVKTPRMLQSGETWIVFLARRNGFYYPLGGVNGLLLLEGEKVIFDNTLKYPHSRSALTRTIAEALHE